MFVRFLVLCCALSNSVAFASEVFAPANCDFTVTFPEKYETREVMAATGQSIVMAKTKNGEPLKLSAECWPLQKISPQGYAKNLGPKMDERGIQVHSVSIDKGQYGDIVTLAGSAGQGVNKYYVRFESFFGKTSRLDLLILEKTAVPSKGNLDFRNSVRVKR